MPTKAAATASPTQTKDLKYQEKKSAVNSIKCSSKYAASNGQVRNMGMAHQETPSVSIFDYSENEENFNESGAVEEESSASQEYDSTHNTSTTSQDDNLSLENSHDQPSGDDEANDQKVG